MKKIRFIALLFFISAALFARDIEIYVEDEDLLMPLDGARITLRSGLQFSSDRNGIARVILPDDNQTVITITYPGYETLRMTIPAAKQTDSAAERFTAIMRLGGSVIQGQELVLEAARPETSETRSGRSVGISERDLERTAEIGIVEDVMSSVKLLPGVGYTGMFGAVPSIRGGDPGDLTAVLDGFYLERPYHWMGAFSIFDPKMVSSARLSHGVFSSRYGHTTSGLLEITSKDPSPTETDLEVGIGSSTASLNMSLPFNGRGGLLFMGRVTYWDTLIWAAKGLSRIVDNENLDMVNSITTAPYIRSGALSANYRFTANTEGRLSGFFGSDGIGADVDVDYSAFTDDGIEGRMTAKADYDNYQGFLITNLNSSPNTKLALRSSLGVGFTRMVTEDYVRNDISVPYNDDFLDKLIDDLYDPTNFLSYFFIEEIEKLRGEHYEAPDMDMLIDFETTTINAQGRFDIDYDLGKGFIAAVGVQELYSRWQQREDILLNLQVAFADLADNEISGMEDPFLVYYINMLKGIEGLEMVVPRTFVGDVTNHGLTSSAYGLVEFTGPKQRFGTELGLRVDHLFFKVEGLPGIMTKPNFNPRLNIDYTFIKNRNNIDSFSATIGTGLFSSINSLLCFFDPDAFDIFGTGVDLDLSNIELKFNRAWTSVIGFKFDFLQKYSFNIEGYYKYIFDRTYITARFEDERIAPQFHFDGLGHVGGFDLQLQRMESRRVDGWITYSFNYAKYKDPSGGGEAADVLESAADWYFPSFHRFHNSNIVLNVKPSSWFNIGIRFGFASGTIRNKVNNEIESYPVIVITENDEGEEVPVIMQRYRRKPLPENERGTERTPWSLPLDVKFSFFIRDIKNRSSLEIYVAAENVLAPIYKPKTDRNSYNSYTGKIEESTSASFDLPIPMVSFGFKWRY